MGSERVQLAEEAVRAVAAAGKALRLYPQGSPMVRHALEEAVARVDAHLASAPVLALKVGRGGFALDSMPLAPGTPGSSELADQLRLHGIEEVSFTPGVTPAELSAFLDVALADPPDVLARGGLPVLLISGGIEHVRAAAVSLTLAQEAAADGPDEDIDAFLRQLATDPDKMAAWLSAASKGDPAALRDGLAELVAAIGESSLPLLVQTLADSFAAQDTQGKDALIGLALDGSSVGEVAESALARVPEVDLAGALMEGLFGQNMLSLSNALVGVAADDRRENLIASVEKLLSTAGRHDREVRFFRHMLAVRTSPSAEAPLVDTNSLFEQLAEATTMSASDIEVAREHATSELESSDTQGVTVLLTLLDQQQDFDLYCRDLDNLVAIVARLAARSRLDLCARILGELKSREGRDVQPWPGLDERIAKSIAATISPKLIGALLRAVTAETASVSDARRLLQVAGNTADALLVREALTMGTEGLAVAERLLQNAFPELLVKVAHDVQWFAVASVVSRLSRESDPRAREAVRALVNRPDDQSRREAALGLATASGDSSLGHLEVLLRDSSQEVAVSAARALSRIEDSRAAELLATRLEQIDVDGKDFPLAREIIETLGRVGDRRTTRVLRNLATRRALVKRGRFAEVQHLARRALEGESSGGGER